MNADKVVRECASSRKQAANSGTFCPSCQRDAVTEEDGRFTCEACDFAWRKYLPTHRVWSQAKNWQEQIEKQNKL
jgi:predicted amidophosphoribosyltransferase